MDMYCLESRERTSVRRMYNQNLIFNDFGVSKNGASNFLDLPWSVCYIGAGCRKKTIFFYFGNFDGTFLDTVIFSLV
jgi:hypothetical protein